MIAEIPALSPSPLGHGQAGEGTGGLMAAYGLTTVRS